MNIEDVQERRGEASKRRGEADAANVLTRGEVFASRHIYHWYRDIHSLVTELACDTDE